MPVALRPCSTTGCPSLVVRGKCGPCAEAAPRHRPTAEQRGYGGRWALNRSGFLRKNPICVLCGAKATVPDHFPTSRNVLVARGTPHPDAHVHLRPLCGICHRRETNRLQSNTRA